MLAVLFRVHLPVLRSARFTFLVYDHASMCYAFCWYTQNRIKEKQYRSRNERPSYNQPLVRGFRWKFPPPLDQKPSSVGYYLFTGLTAEVSCTRPTFSLRALSSVSSFIFTPCGRMDVEYRPSILEPDLKIITRVEHLPLSVPPRIHFFCMSGGAVLPPKEPKGTAKLC